MAPNMRSFNMTDLVVRRLLIDLKPEIQRHWAGGDAFRTALFNALSMSFPIGEQFFIDSVRDGAKQLPPEQRERIASEVQGFIGQEATHRRIHDLFNGHLEKQGLVNGWEKRIARRTKHFDGMDVRHRVAATAATEHFTAIFAEWLLTHPKALEGAEERLHTMWMWHASEESEHRSTAFDVYRALDGNEAWRRYWFRMGTVFFLVDLLRQTVNNLWRDGSLFKWSTWRSGWHYLFGEIGWLRQMYRPWRRYLAADFHPAQQDDTPAMNWLRDNADQFRAVSASAPSTAESAA
jgi:uncharacterized protein